MISKCVVSTGMHTFCTTLPRIYVGRVPHCKVCTDSLSVIYTQICTTLHVYNI